MKTKPVIHAQKFAPGEVISVTGITRTGNIMAFMVVPMDELHQTYYNYHVANWHCVCSIHHGMVYFWSDLDITNVSVHVRRQTPIRDIILNGMTFTICYN